MPGFTPNPEILKLEFDGTSLEGLVIRARCCTVGQWNQMLIESGDRTGAMGQEVADGNNETIQKFLDFVVNWNLEVPVGNPVPPTLQVFQDSFSSRQGALIIAMWQRGMMEVPTISSRGSSDGEDSPEQQLDLAKSLESLPNWQPPSSS